MKILRPLFILLLLAGNARGINVTIIESQSFNSGQQMDVNWQTVANGMGYTATVNPQSTLLTNSWFATTDILVVSSGVIVLPQQAVDTIQSFIAGGGHVYLQSEYLSSYTTDGAFQSITVALGGNFSWTATTNGDLVPMMVLGSLSNTPNPVSSLSYFWYGVYGAGIGCDSRIEPFLQYQGQYYGFIFGMPTGTGRMITNCDQDWINNYTTTTGGLELMENILSNLATPNYTIAAGGGAGSITVPGASICGGQPVTLTATPVGGISGTYLWSPGGATTQSITVNPTVNTAYIVQYITSCGTVADTSHVTVSVPTASALTQSICSGTAYNFNGQSITTAGTYRDTTTNANGCDSILVLTVTVLQSTTTFTNGTICNGSSYTFGGQTLTAAGTYNDTLTGSSGCDSIITLTLSLMPATTTPVTRTICNGSSYVFNGQTLTTAGAYNDTLTGSSGCDSIVVLTLQVASTVTVAVNGSFCAGSSYNFHGQTLTNPGAYTDTLATAGGCDSIVVLSLTMVQPTTTFLNQSFCNGSSITFGSQTITTTGTYLDTLTGVAGCDSFIILTVNINPTSATALGISVCSGSSYSFAGQTLTSPGTYADTLSNAIGCDSIVTLTLTVLANSSAAMNQNICSGSNYTFNGVLINVAGTYTDTLTSAAGCDSIVTLTLNVILPVTTTLSQSVCSGTHVTFNGRTVSSSGVYTDTLTGALGCDSIVILTLTVLPVSATAISQTVCGNGGFVFNGRNLAASGTYTDTLTNTVGCDSVVTLTLLIVPISFDSTSAAICSGTSYMFRGQEYSVPGIYRDTLTGVAGCDSIITLALAVQPIPVADFAVLPSGKTMPPGNIFISNLSTGADSYTWQMNGQYIVLVAGSLLPVTQAGNYCVTLTATTSAGCTDTASDCFLVYNNTFFLPNVFTPNGDGANDDLELFGPKAGIVNLSFSVFDRWGEKVFESNDPNFKWDGTYRDVMEKPGVFVYQLDITFNDGTSAHNRGSVTLLR
jgi:gliding motility-associated-like protein